jgi:hypothetical protein
VANLKVSLASTALPNLTGHYVAHGTRRFRSIRIVVLFVLAFADPVKVQI